MRHHTFLLCFIILFTSCAANVKEKVIQDAQSGRCDQAIAVFEKNATNEKVWQKSKQIGGYAATGAVTGVVIVSEAILYTVPGIAVGAIICSPILAVEIATKSKSRAGLACTLGIGQGIARGLVPPREAWISSKVWNNTKKWRVESYDELSQMLRNTAQCYAERPTPDDLLTAEKQLLSIRESLWEKLSDEEKTRVDALLSAVQITKRK